MSLFRYFYEKLPPLFPKDKAQKIKISLDKAESNPDLSTFEIEEIMIPFGYEAWPWNKAYDRFYEVSKDRMGENFLLPRLPDDLRKKYLAFKSSGGNWEDLHSGKEVHHFSSEERVDLLQALLNMEDDLDDYTDREVIGLGKEKYLEYVEEYQNLLEEIKNKLYYLKQWAETETDHPILPAEILSKVRAFEYGLCLLGPDFNYNDVKEAVDFFEGRKDHLNSLRGIDRPLENDLEEEE